MFSKEGGCQLMVALRVDELAALCNAPVSAVVAVYFLGVKLRPAPALAKQSDPTI